MKKIKLHKIVDILRRWWGVALIVFLLSIAYSFYNGEEPTLPEDQNQSPTDENVIVPKIKPAKSNTKPSSKDSLSISSKSKPNAQDKKQPKSGIIDKSRIEIIPDSDIIVEDGNEAVEKAIEELLKRERLSEGSTLILPDLEPDSRIGGGKYYRADQKHRGIPVDKIGIVVEVDESGKLLRINSEAINIDDDIVLEPEITWEEALTRWLDENNYARYELIEETPETVIHVENDTGIRLAYKLVIEVFDDSDNSIHNITLYLSTQNGEELSRNPNIIH